MSSGASFPAAAACVLLATAAAIAASASAEPQDFVVGGEARGWRKPTPSDETYNHWAARNRFRVGDFLHFRYDKNDSVLVVSRDDYKLCGAARPALRFDGGDTRFRLDHSGFLYFISGAPGHCDAGQRMTARVMAPQEGRGRVGPAPTKAPAAAMPPAGGGDEDEGGSYGPVSGGGSRPPPGSGAAAGSRPPPSSAGAGGEDAKNSGAASVRAPSLFAAGYHLVVGAVLGAALLVLTA